MLKKFRGFTLIELMVVVIIMAVIAAFGIPSYNKALEKVDEKEAVHNLRFIAEALELYNVRNAGYPPSDLPQISDINTTLSIGIVEQNIDYNCTANAPDMTCSGVSDYGWTVQYVTSSALNDEPTCSTGGCPSCASVGCSYLGKL